MIKRRNGRGGSRQSGPEFGEKGSGLGFSGRCICVKCGYSPAKRRGVPCKEEKCPNCGVVLLREGGYHHVQSLKKS